jgi:GH24 family phage-related lysozyme (muramidase)
MIGWLRWNLFMAERAMDGPTYTAHFEAPGGKPVLMVYGDPLTGREPWTVGLGHTGPDVKQGETWTVDRCLAAFYNDYAIAESAAVHLFGASCWAGLTVPRKAVLTDLCFNPGPAKICRGDWSSAASELLDSAYAHQVGGRAVKNAKALESGEWP